ncbi:MAG: 2-dehydropantoate 2-reductase [SAR202 cluster bacterium]|nr:2-dehydropantoate 2-reductase [SAR202 cluster bacterium]
MDAAVPAAAQRDALAAGLIAFLLAIFSRRHGLRIAVIGAGAVGGYYGGVLARHGEEVFLICRGANRDAIARNGLKVDSHWGNFTVKPTAMPDPKGVGPVDLVIYAVKLYSNPEALPLIKPLLGPRTVILPIQNGAESPAKVAEVYGWDRVVAGTTYIETARVAPGHIHQSGSTARIAFGEQDGSISDRVRMIEKVLTKEGIQVEVSKDIRSTLWSKLVAVAAIGTVMTAFRSSYVDVLANPEGERTVQALMEEIVLVGKSQGVKFAPDVVTKRMAGAREEAREMVSSLQLDFNAGNPLELDDLIGAVVRAGRKSGVPVPASAALYGALYGFRTGGRR